MLRWELNWLACIHGAVKLYSSLRLSSSPSLLLLSSAFIFTRSSDHSDSGRVVGGCKQQSDRVDLGNLRSLRGRKIRFGPKEHESSCQQFHQEMNQEVLSS